MKRIEFCFLLICESIFSVQPKNAHINQLSILIQKQVKIFLNLFSKSYIRDNVTFWTVQRL